MPTGKDIENRNHITGFKEEINKAFDKSEESFFTWFDHAEDANAAFIRGFWDFTVHIAFPIKNYITKPEEKTIMEIGHGGGRILAAASRHFKKVIGIDIHEKNELVFRELKKRGLENFELIQTDGKNIPLNDQSIDLVYSFIVLQHVEKISIFERYLNEAFRVLKPGGIAVLYFGRYYRFSLNRSSRLFYLIDRILERVILKGRFLEIPARVNETNLRVSVDYAKKLSKACGFQVIKTLVSHKKVPDGIHLYGGQNGLVLKK